ncbi:futalosine hydrolase [Stieleria sp. TO1_6]|nr:futalosine hydrolase [Stieleria tagensis]
MPNLILIPTETERQQIEPALRFDPRHWAIETIGFGVIASAIATTAAITRHRPDRVILAGIAGLLPGDHCQSLAIGDAIWFTAVAIDGIGVGQGDSYVDAVDLGWPWYPTEDPEGHLHCWHPGSNDAATLLTVCTGSADADDAQRRSARHPKAVGEDMESFAVALACRSANVPLGIVRGFSNFVGRREQADWRIDQALRSVATVLQQELDRSTT